MCFSWRSFRRRAQDPQVGNSYSVPHSRWIFALNFLYVLLLGTFQATRPRSSGRELVQCAAFAINLLRINLLRLICFECFVCVSPGYLSGDAPKILRSGINFRFGFFNVFLLASLRRRVQDPQVRHSYRVGRRVYAPKIPVFVCEQISDAVWVFRPVAIEYQTPLIISGTCIPRKAGNIEHEAYHVLHC